MIWKLEESQSEGESDGCRANLGSTEDVYPGDSLCFILVVVTVAQFSLCMCTVEENSADDCPRRSLWGNTISMPFFHLIFFFLPSSSQVGFHDLVSWTDEEKHSQLLR